VLTITLGYMTEILFEVRQLIIRLIMLDPTLISKQKIIFDNQDSTLYKKSSKPNIMKF